jgi:hypothetical protein
MQMLKDDWSIPEDLASDEEPLTNIVYDISNEDYHAHPSISKSGLDAVAKSPAHFISNKHIETPAFKKGTLIHCAVLEPDYLDSRYFGMTEKIDKRTKIGKEKFAEYEIQSGGRIIVTAEEMVMASRIRDEVGKHKIASQLFTGGMSETSIFSKFGDTAVRCRPDYWNGEIVIDLKSTDDALSGFTKSTHKYRYYVQHPFYVDIMEKEGVEIANFLFVAIEKTEPFGICIYELDEEAIDYGRREYNANLDTYRRCLESGLWPGYEEAIKTLSLPRYAINTIEQRLDAAA